MKKIRESRRSIVIVKDLKSGHIISESDVTFKRPGSGITPGDLKYVLGRKLNKDLKADELLKWENLLD